MAKKPAKKVEPKVILEREYIVPLRREWLKVPKYKRATKAVKALKQFLVKHMKIYDRDLRKIKIDIDLNNEIKFRGMQRPPSKIKVKANKLDNGTVRAFLVDIPEIIKYKQARILRKKTEQIKRSLKKKESNKAPEEKKDEQSKEKALEAKEKEESSKQEGLKEAKQDANEIKHTSQEKRVVVHQTKLSR